MKCDELKRKYSDITGPYYGYNEVNEAIAELEQTIEKLAEAKKSAELILQNLLDCGIIKEWYFNGKFNAVLKADDPHLQIAELKKENERLKDKLRHYPMMAALIGSDNKEIRRLKRALWLARASEASKEVNYWTCQDESSYAIVDFNIRHETIVSYKSPHHRPYKWILIWDKVERKCRAKAEEYK